MSAEEIIEINHLTNRYNQAADSGNGEAFAETFTEDGILESREATQLLAETLLQFLVTPFLN